MKKLLLTMAIIIGLCVPALAAEQRRITTPISATGDTIFNVPSTTVVYTKAFWIKSARNADDVTLMYKATSPGAVDLNISFQQSYTFPVTEGVADVKFLTTHAIDAALTDQNWHLVTIDSVAMPVARFMVDGDGSNSGSTTIQIKVGKH